MLMEHSAEISHGTEIGEKSRALDLKKLCSSKLWASTGGSPSSGSNGLKRKLGSKASSQNGVRKRSKKEVLLSSLSSGGKNKKSGGRVYHGQGRLSSSDESGKSELGGKQKGNGSGSLGGISLNLNSNVNIPKRPRDLVRRRKVEGDVGLKQEGTSSSKASSAPGGGAQLNESTSGNLLQNGDGDRKVAQNSESEGGAAGRLLAKVKRKKNSDDLKETRSSGSDLLLRLKGDDSHSSARSGSSLTKKARRNPKKSKKGGTASPGVTKETKQVLDESSRICDDSQDDEENLEANAARMLSSRFDPSCTGFSFGGKSSKLPSTNGLSAFSPSSRDSPASEPISRAESDIASGDAEARVLRPRDSPKGKGHSKQRRHFYEIISRELDSYWLVNRRIKVFWPLDQSWYFGHVIGYDPEKKLHHIKYDDRDEEWIDLQNERFKLLLFPSEVPGKVGRKKSRTHDNHARKEKHGETTDKEGNSSSYMESEPIISWLARSARCKSPPFGARKKQKAYNESAKSQSSSFSDGKIDPRGSLEVGSSGRNADDSVCSSALLENSGDSLCDRKPPEEKLISHCKRAPIVYFRRRFHKKETPPVDVIGEELCQLSPKAPVCEAVPEFIDSVDLDTNMLGYMDRCVHHTKRLRPEELIWTIDDSGLLKLSVPVTSLKVFRVELGFSLPVVINELFGGQGSFFMHQHGTVVSLWPRVHLEMLFVDNIVGLRFLLFEGCFKQAVFFVFLVMAIFNQSNPKDVDQQLPVTSIRFRLFGAQDFHRQLVFTLYNFREVSDSKWSYLDRKLNRHCLLTKQLPPAECTYDNVMALRNGRNHLPLTLVSLQPSSVSSLRKRSRQPKMKISSRQSACLKLSRLSFDGDVKHGELPAFALSFAAAPTFFLSLHLKLLMERSIPSSSFLEYDPMPLMDHSENDSRLVSVDRFLGEDNPVESSLSVGGNLASDKSEMESCSKPGCKSNDRASSKPSNCSQDSQENEDVDLQLEKGKGPSEHSVLSAQHPDAYERLSPVEASVGFSPLKGMTVEIPSCDLIENDAIVRSPNPTAGSILHRNRGALSASTNLSPARSGGKQDFLRNGFGHGPKKPRTQVSYSLPLGGDHNSKSKFHHAKGFSHKRIRKASEKKTSEAFGGSQRNMELLSCDGNVLVTAGDRGWRECGARVVLELVDNNEWRLVVKVLGESKYSYKAHQFMQPGTTNRYTHVMMWKGGKDWILEFPDRTQWTTFKEMHEECFNRNLRAASVKNIPIPGVRLMEENDDSVPETPFVRPSPKYYWQMETDIDIAMDPSRVLYDMDSDDERWIGEHRGLDSNQSGCGDVSDEMFEKAMDVFEKVAYAKQSDHISSDELEEDMAALGPLETIKIIYEHWRTKRQRKGMPLLRHLQPPLWEKYQQQVTEWEQAVMKSNAVLSNGCQEKPFTIEKPPMFAFCLKPRGLEVPNRGSKQRSQKRLPLGALGHVISADSDGLHSLVGRRSNGYAFGDERVVYAAYNHGTSDTSPVLQGSTRVFSPRDAGGVGYLSLSSDGSERNHYPKLYRNKSRKLYLIPPSNDTQAFSPYSQRSMAKRSAVHGWSMGSSEWPNQMHYLPDGFQRHRFDQLDPSELDEFRLRDAASAARHAVTIAKMKRENAQRMLCRADLAMHKAVAAIMTAEVIKASNKEPRSDV